MKNVFLASALVLFSLSSFASGEELNLTIPDEFLHEPKQEVKVTEKYDHNGIFYDVELKSIAIIPSDVTVGIGISSSSKTLEAEVFAGLNAIRLASGNSIHIPYGARVRVALNDNKTIYAEYTYQDIADFGNKEGLFENPHTISIIKMSKNGKSYWGCGIGQSVHHAWSDESHAPEKSLAPFCRFGKRF